MLGAAMLPGILRATPLRLLTLLLCLLLAACSGSRARAPVGERLPVAVPASSPASRPAVHLVRRGESLFSIAWQYGLDYHRLAQINGIGPPYTIYVGQRLRLKAAPAVPAPPRKKATSPAPQRKGTARKEARTKAAAGVRRQARSAQPAVALRWQWPVRGRLLKRFDGRSTGKKGIAIAGRAGQKVKAAAAGRVVYAGSGLVGYGRLIIIKHNNIFLSAYGHNRRLLVKEGDAVRAGQVIAEMGNSGTNRVMLHFEIRRNGRPVDPLGYLPRS
ncbi:peptidoglycan DD-metalloendopeptidase family protein [Thiohalobacter sp. IOR34]|uniref:peptidoglycan DD-metalloendopeptidase family protein n=1 Tax=Thiohalobacter sp. IOR34 TaxID=3057176 RepID=UPI0025B26288|nr:peptidoglycan DD-metalloendopeptidase family protein [Thiohalobacter sp. IOR34]WJW76609.1 peptidoglycan DD-metalloendopeptidase family protein [Thiohalobacter sp. IOR34]